MCWSSNILTRIPSLTFQDSLSGTTLFTANKLLLVVKVGKTLLANSA